MKKLITLLAVVGLSGCVAYPYPYGAAEVHYGSSPYYGTSGPYVVEQPVYIQGRGYARIPRHSRDRDHDGRPDRYDRDRDGDGVPNRFDARPDNPRRY